MKKTTQKSKDWSNNFISFSPTKVDKEEAMKLLSSFQETVEFLATYTEDQQKIKIDWDDRNSCYRADLMTVTEDWKDAVHLTARHTDIVKALCLLHVALRDHYPAWPITPMAADKVDTDW